MNLHQALKSQTAQLHNEIENDLDLMRLDLSRQDYQTVLERFYSFYVPFENLLHESIYSDFLKPRSKISHLIKDLSFLGVQIDGLDHFSEKDLFPLNTPEQILGVLYVLEGSTLGGRILTQHFSTKFDFSPEEGINFFNCYGVKTGIYWKEFLEFMEKERIDKSLKEELIISSAKNAFQALNKWLTQKGIS